MVLRFATIAILLASLAIFPGGQSAAFAGQWPTSTDTELRRGIEALHAGKVHEAGEIFAAAAVRDPSSADLRTGVALVAYAEGRYAEAGSALHDALAIAPKDVNARLLLGRLQRRTGDLQSAVHTYEALQADHPSAAVAETLARWRREDDLHSQMQQAVGVHFSVAFEGPAESALADRALASLEKAYDRIGDALAFYPVTPILVVLYTKEQFRDITQAPTWAGGGYDGIIRVPMRGALAGPELDRVLAHEFTHALQAAITTVDPPRWFSEGLAGALERDDISRHQAVVAGQTATVPLAALAAPFGRLSTEDAAIAYAASAIVMRRLLDEVGGMAIANILRDLDDGVPFEQAFAHRAQRTLQDFAAEVEAP